MGEGGRTDGERQTRERRRHGYSGNYALAKMPLDGGGARTRALRPRDPQGSCRLRVLRTELESGRVSFPTPFVLAKEIPLEDDPSPHPGPVALEWDGSCLRIQVGLPAGTSFYGAGLVAAPLLRNGRLVVFWNTDAFRYGEESPSLYQSHPWVLGVLPDGKAVGILADSVRRGAVQVADDGVEFQFEAEPFDLWILDGESPEEVLEGLASLIGTLPLPPLHALGYHQCRYSYESEDELLTVARGFREKKIPCDTLWLDIHYMDRYRSFSWNPVGFPDPRRMLGEVAALGFKVVTILDPGIVADPVDPVCRSGLEGDHFILGERDGTPIRGRVWPGLCHFPDFARKETRSWWADLVKRWTEQGIDGIWIDMNEPSVFRNPTHTLPVTALHRGHGGGPHGAFHNVYGQLMAEATRDGVAAARPGRRPFVLTRSSHLGGVRSAAVWTGDNQSTWQDLRWTIPMVLSLGLSGQPFAGPDLGGFDGDPEPELFARWFQTGALLPFCRGHAKYGSCRKEPWAFGAEIEEIVRDALCLRMKLLPQLYTVFHEASVRGLPVVRPLFMADPRDARLREIDDAYLLGDSLLVAPVLEPGARTRTVTLPRGGWYKVSSLRAGSDPLREDRVELEAPLATLPLLARAGSILCTGKGGCTTEEAMGGDLHLLIFLDDKGKARGTLYEDEGDGFGHLSGAYRLTTFEALWTGRGLSLTTSVRGSRPATRGRLTVSVFGPGLDGKMAVPRDVPFGMTTTNHEILP